MVEHFRTEVAWHHNRVVLVYLHFCENLRWDGLDLRLEVAFIHRLVVLSYHALVVPHLVVLKVLIFHGLLGELNLCSIVKWFRERMGICESLVVGTNSASNFGVNPIRYLFVGIVAG